MKKQISVANLVMLVGGALTFLFSFFTFYDSNDASAWGDFAFPIAALIALMGLAMAVVTVLDLLGVKLPAEVLTFNWRQIDFVWGLTSAGFMLAFLIQEKGPGGSGIGMSLMFLSSLAMLVGSTLALLGKGSHLISLPTAEPATAAGTAAAAPAEPAPPPVAGGPPVAPAPTIQTPPPPAPLPPATDFTPPPMPPAVDPSGVAPLDPTPIDTPPPLPDPTPADVPAPAPDRPDDMPPSPPPPPPMTP